MTKHIRMSAAFAGTTCAALLSWTTVPDALVAEDATKQIVRLDLHEMEEFGVKVEVAGPGKLNVHVNLPGEVVIDPDRLAHIVPRVGGVVRQVIKKLGDRVRADEILAVLDSRELSELKSGYLVARERAELAVSTFSREDKLWKEQISSEKEYLQAKQALAETRIEMRAEEQKLHALGFSKEYLEDLIFAYDELFTRYEITAPFSGVIIEKHITFGEMIEEDAVAFIIADLSSVWAVLTVYQKDLSRIRPGQAVRIGVGDGEPRINGSISYVSPVVDEATRTTKARVVLPNADGRWRPGSFVTGEVTVEETEARLIVPKSAVQIVKGEQSVFVETDEGFEPQPVRTGRTTETHVEISAGLQPGSRYVARGAFTLKAQLAKDAFADDHGY